jgi:hypothetical protein
MKIMLFPMNLGDEIGGKFHIFRQTLTATYMIWSTRRFRGNKNITSWLKNVLKSKQ